MHENFTLLDATDNSVQSLQDRVKNYKTLYNNYITRYYATNRKPGTYVQNCIRIVQDFSTVFGQSINHLNLICISNFIHKPEPKYDVSKLKTHISHL